MRIIWQLVTVAALAAGTAGLWYGTPYLRAQDASTEAGRRETAPVHVVVEPVRTGEIADVIEAVGTVNAREAITVTSKQTGTVETIRFDEGEWVERGTVLVELANAEAEAEFAATEAERRNAVRLLERARALLDRQAVPEARVDELRAELERTEAASRAARARLSDLRITAPFDGMTGLRRVSPGALVTPGAAITTLDDIRVVRVGFRVPEQALGRLNRGLPVVATTDAYGGETFRGEVSVTDTRIDPATRSVEVLADLDNPDFRLRPGMFMTVRLTTRLRPDAVLVPGEALTPAGERQFVFVVADGRAERREVTIGERLEGLVEVISGLNVGELVIVRGIQQVKDGAAVVAETAAPADA